MAEFARALQSQNIWFQAAQYRDAEIKLVQYRMSLVAGGDSAKATPKCDVATSAAKELAAEMSEKAANYQPRAESKAREMISDLKKELTSDSNAAIGDINSMLDRVLKLEKENNDIKKQLTAALARLDLLEKPSAGASVPVASAPAPENVADDDDDEDEDSDVDLFGSDSDEEVDEEAEALKAKRIAEYNARKAEKAATKGATIAKSMVTIDVKPFDDQTDLAALGTKIKEMITMEGLVWGAEYKLVPMAFGIKKLVLTAIVEDALVSTDDLTERIEEYEDEVQSTDIAAFNKL